MGFVPLQKGPRESPHPPAIEDTGEERGLILTLDPAPGGEVFVCGPPADGVLFQQPQQPQTRLFFWKLLVCDSHSGGSYGISPSFLFWTLYHPTSQAPPFLIRTLMTEL